ncbi:hypothetical protein K5P26_11880 [Sphingopyxis sp. XHP0097]|uniref:Sulfotransferase domain-containing protein n=1 Tax=Sphingopyxis jiangsuensis TaxID=2871171 RepID=A0ABS7MFP4_9SPHN|nr:MULTISPECIES: hypothetical protein [Sphingopyxis]MBL0769056.1 hypothetical protein [Sphingopyxis lutea]MBY4637838.1 hypothetical protein [Sphingopyxis jiangsuensis]
MPRILVKADTLDTEAERFDLAPLAQPVFLNSVPKSGSHLLRNILRMFVPVQQQYRADFIQWANLQQHRAAFDPAAPRLSWGHLFFADASAIETAPARRILLYRDPYDWVIARARFFASEQFSGNMDFLKSKALSIDELLTMMIFGLPGKAPSLNDIYEMNAAAWLGARVHIVRFEDLATHVADLDNGGAEDFFGALLDACGIARPDDWRDRVRIGSDRRQSATARENLTGVEHDFPSQLPRRHKALVDYHAPGLRALLGYD